MERMRLERKIWELIKPLDTADPHGFGDMFEARSTDGVSGVAKMIPKNPGADREMLFDGVGRRNVIPILDSGEHRDKWVIVMPPAAKSLGRHLKENGPLSEEEVIVIMRDVALALSDMESDIVHRDLKPGNILLLDGTWCLADFGLARYADAATAQHTWKQHGTHEYIAPERWKGQRATIATDVYSLGITAYELFTGAVPFPGPDFAQQHLSETAPLLNQASPLLASLIAECLMKLPETRPRPADLLTRLDQIAHNPPKGGLATLAEANRAVVQRRAIEEGEASEEQTEQERRLELIEAGLSALARLSETLLNDLASAAPSGALAQTKGGGWTFMLGQAQLQWDQIIPVGPEDLWLTRERPPFDVIAYSSISLSSSAGRFDYGGRGHSLWFCDAKISAYYRWFETAFMNNPLARKDLPQIEPFALAPEDDARRAVSSGIDAYQVAWPFTPLDVTTQDDFISRWAQWLALAAEGRLLRPGALPERPVTDSWRQ